MTVAGDTTEEIGTRLTENCEAVSEWMKGNRLKLNASKTHLMTVGTGARLRTQTSPVVVMMDGHILEESEENTETLLGLQIEPGLKWHNQVEELLAKLKKRLTGLSHLRNILAYDLRKQITEGMFTSVLVYCLPVFGGCDKYEMEALQIMQNKAARLVTHAPKRASRNEIFEQIGWLTVNQLTFYHSALSTNRIRKSKEPEYLSNIMSRDNRAQRIIIPNTDLTLAMNSYCYRGAAQWNRLPQHIRNTRKIGQFKSKLKSWIKLNVPRFVNN